MKSASEIEVLIKRTKARTNAATDARILADAEASLWKPAKKQTKVSRLNFSFVLETIMNRLVLKFAVATVVIIGVLLGIYQLSDGPSRVYGEMIEAMKQMPWVHWTVTSQETDEIITESWIGFEDSIFAHKRSNGTLLCNIGNMEYTYSPQQNEVYFSNTHDISREQEFFPIASFQIVQITIDHLTKEASEITRESFFQGEQEIELVVAKMIGSSDVEEVELKRDVRQNLLLSLRVDYKDSNKDIVGIYDYPENGPKSIFDLGAPENSKVVSLIIPPDIPQLIKRLDTLRQTLLTNYVVISLPSDIEKLPTSYPYRIPRYFTSKDNLASIIWREENERCHSMGYFSEEIAAMLRIESMPENIQSISQKLLTVSSTIYKASKRRIFHYQILNGKPVRNIRRGPVETYGSEVFIEQICWPRIVMPQNTPVEWEVESVTGSNNEPLIMIERVLESGIKKRWFLNPARNYICQRNELFNVSSPISAMEILEYARTPNGQWYPRKIQKTEYERIRRNGEMLPEISYKVIYLFENPVFPKGLFDPDNLPRIIE